MSNPTVDIPKSWETLFLQALIVIGEIALLATWREQGLLLALSNRAKKNMAYTKPTKTDEQPSLFSDGEDDKLENQ